MNRYMLIFAAMVIGTFLIALWSRNAPRNRLNAFGHPLPNLIGLVIPVVAFSLFSGLRNAVGDTETYMYSYRLMDLTRMEAVHFQFEGGSFYNVLQYMMRQRFEDPYALIFVTALFAVVPVVIILYKYSAPYELGIVLYVLTTYYVFSMNGIRQYAAAGILLLGTKCLLSEKKTDFFKYLIFVAFAWLWHTSALIMIPVYFIVRRRAWTPMTLAILGGTVLMTLTFNNFLSPFLGILENTDYSVYAENGWFTSGSETGSNFIRVVVLAVPLVLAYVARDRMLFLYGRKWEIMVNLSILNLAFYILSLYNWIFARLAVYTGIYFVVMLTYLIQDSFSDERQSSPLYPISLAYFSVFFYFQRFSILEYTSAFF